MRRRFATQTGAILRLAVVVALAGCATTVDPDVSRSAAGDVSTTVFVATGSTAKLLDQLAAEAIGLSEAIVENEGQRDILGRIDALWEGAAPGVEDGAPEALADFERTIDLMRRAVERRSPADADKALNNLRPLIAALPVERGPDERGAG